ncbi:MAG: hypothetical protein A2018_06370 [Alphaproteobacteria bacterium GWF2_58_20]|nr:MAG: hypothetical protein A2018_06370 [Alphaproteobacteria bacterium GWF2_58_20]
MSKARLGPDVFLKKRKSKMGKLSADMKSQIISQFLAYQEDIERNRSQKIAASGPRERMAQQDRMVEAIHADDLLGIINAYEEGAEINVVDRTYGELPLNLATAMDDAAPFLLMLNFEGADVNARGRDGNTPLHIASRNADFFCARKLLLKRADSLAKNDAGQVPLAVLDVERDAGMNGGSCHAVLVGGMEIHLRNRRVRALDIEGRRVWQDVLKGLAPGFRIH